MCFCEYFAIFGFFIQFVESTMSALKRIVILW
jgi:hypothetical protein